MTVFGRRMIWSLLLLSSPLIDAMGSPSTGGNTNITDEGAKSMLEDKTANCTDTEIYPQGHCFTTDFWNKTCIGNKNVDCIDTIDIWNRTCIEDENAVPVDCIDTINIWNKTCIWNETVDCNDTISIFLTLNKTCIGNETVEDCIDTIGQCFDRRFREERLNLTCAREGVEPSERRQECCQYKKEETCYNYEFLCDFTEREKMLKEGTNCKSYQPQVKCHVINGDYIDYVDCEKYNSAENSMDSDRGMCSKAGTRKYVKEKFCYHEEEKSMQLVSRACKDL